MKNIFGNKYLFTALFALAAMACAFAATDLNVNAAAPGANVSPLAAPTPPAKTTKTKTAPDALVADLYKQHDAQKSPFFQNTNRALVDKYFTKATADLIWKDAVAADGEVGAIDGDPLYDAQDTDIKKFAIGKSLVKDKTATVPVTFTNFGEKQTITFALTEESGAWKIEDIKYSSGGSLLGNFQDSAAGDGSTAETPNGNFEGKYQIGATTCTVRPIKMAFEVKWEKGKGTEIFFSQGRASDKFIFASDPPKGKANVFSFDDENYNTGIFYRADGKEFPIKRIN